MPILRAGPWGNLTDAFQNTGSAGAYPVNIAKGNWPTQNWAAWYEAEVAGCCTPTNITGTFDDGVDTFIGTDTWDNGDCERYVITGTHPYYGSAYTWELIIEWNGTKWDASFFDYSPGSVQSDGELDNGDACDPTGTYTMSYGTLEVT